MCKGGHELCWDLQILSTSLAVLLRVLSSWAAPVADWLPFPEEEDAEAPEV